MPRSAINEHAAALNKRSRRRRPIAANHWRPEMSATLSTIARPAGTKSPGVSRRIFTACWERIAHYVVRRAAIARLRELDGDALRDIGLARSEIEAAVYGLMTAPSRERI
jgi:uncharacterized protein YjiS (DUF1127 family)